MEYKFEILALVSAILIIILFLAIAKSTYKEVYFEAYTRLKINVKKAGKNLNWYKRTEVFLNCNGARFHFGKGINPFSYLALNIVLALIGFLLAVSRNFSVALLMGFVFSRISYLMIIYLNRKDNVKMLPDIKLIYNALEIQIKAGVYLTDALAECYGSVSVKRLKVALLNLTGDLVVKSDAYLALENFQSNFNNSYIDNLCITLVQALESGQAIELLSDISDQIKDMQKTVLERKKASLDRKMTFYQLGILVALMIVVIYACITKMYSAITNF